MEREIDFILDEHSSCRKTAKEFGVSRQTIYNDVQRYYTYVQDNFYGDELESAEEKFWRVQKIFNENLSKYFPAQRFKNIKK